MTRWKYAAVITFVLGSVGVSYLLRSTKTSPAAAPAVPKSLGCRFAVGDTLAYKLHTSSSASGAAAGQGGSLQLDAMMWWKVLAQKGGGWVVAGSLQEVRMSGGAEADSASTAQLTDPFVFSVGTLSTSPSSRIVAFNNMVISANPRSPKRSNRFLQCCRIGRRCHPLRELGKTGSNSSR